MPKLIDQAIYDLTFELTTKELASSTVAFKTFDVVYPMNTAMYRYSSAKFSDGSEAGARKIWSPVEKDLENRWTGSGLSGPAGSVGLYLSLEQEKDRDTQFSELCYYQSTETGSAMTGIEYFEFADRKVARDVSALFYMFLFHTTKPLTGINLLVPQADDEEASFVAQVFKQIPKPLRAAKTARAAYLDDKDASFCRAIGNACLQDKRYDFLLVTSTRNVANKNVVIKSAEGGAATKPLVCLQGAGRTSFFLNSDGSTQAETTTSDLVASGQMERQNLSAAAQQNRMGMPAHGPGQSPAGSSPLGGSGMTGTL